MAVPIPPEIIQKLKLSTADENNCKFAFDQDGVDSVGLEIRKIDPRHAIELAEQLDTTFNKRKWIDFSKTL